MFFGNSPVSWCSKMQTLVTQSTTESEYVALCLACNEGMYIKHLLTELEVPWALPEPVYIHEDSQGCIDLANKPTQSQRTKHIEIKYHVVKEHVEKRNVTLIQIPTGEQTADTLTKGLGTSTFQFHCPRISGRPKNIHFGLDPSRRLG
jgi:hypothetical protein